MPPSEAPYERRLFRNTPLCKTPASLPHSASLSPRAFLEGTFQRRLGRKIDVPLFRKALVFEVSPAVRIAHFESVLESQPHHAIHSVPAKWGANEVGWITGFYFSGPARVWSVLSETHDFKGFRQAFKRDLNRTLTGFH